jgi:hypothetical protein
VTASSAGTLVLLEATPANSTPSSSGSASSGVWSFGPDSSGSTSSDDAALLDSYSRTVTRGGARGGAGAGWVVVGG